MAFLRPRSKYGAVKTTVDGIEFASKKEAQRYCELKLLEKAGEIAQLRCQAPFELWVLREGRGLRDGRVDIGCYIADFVYFDRRAQQEVIEDVKGFKTPLYRWKKRHVEAQLGITIREL